MEILPNDYVQFSLPFSLFLSLAQNIIILLCIKYIFSHMFCATFEILLLFFILHSSRNELYENFNDNLKVIRFLNLNHQMVQAALT